MRSSRPLPAASRKARLLRAFLRGDPVHCTWQLSPRCESYCHFCEHRAESAADGLDAEAIASVAAALGRRGSLLVTFTGSEPFLREDLPDVVSAVASRHFPLLVTNGWLASPARARAAWEAGLEAATVALEDAIPARHDAATGQPGSHERAVAGLRALADGRTRAGQQVTIRTRLRDADVSPVERLLALAAEHEVTLTVEAAFPLPSLDGQAVGVVRRLRELRRRHPRLRTTGRALDGLAEALGGGAPGCRAGRAFFNVDHRGRVTKCVEFRDPADGLGTLPADAAGLGARLRAAHASNDCRACWYASRAEIEALYTVRGLLAGLRTLVTA